MLTSAGGGYTDHTKNKGLHPGCNDECPGFQFMKGGDENKNPFSNSAKVRLLYLMKPGYKVPESSKEAVENPNFFKLDINTEDPGYISSIRELGDGLIFLDEEANCVYVDEWVKRPLHRHSTVSDVNRFIHR